MTPKQILSLMELVIASPTPQKKLRELISALCLSCGGLGHIRNPFSMVAGGSMIRCQACNGDGFKQIDHKIGPCECGFDHYKEFVNFTDKADGHVQCARHEQCIRSHGHVPPCLFLSQAVEEDF